MGHKATEGVGYLVGKVWKGNESSSSNNNNYNSSSYHQNRDSGYDQYEKFDDNKKDENLLGERYY
jgi:hypothetical protein